MCRSFILTKLCYVTYELENNAFKFYLNKIMLCECFELYTTFFSLLVILSELYNIYSLFSIK